MKFKGDTTELLIGLWKAFEKAGGRPTIHFIKRIAREAGASFGDHDAQRILLPFEAKANEFRRTENRAQTHTSSLDTKKERTGSAQVAHTSRTENRAQTHDSRTPSAQVAHGIRGRGSPYPYPYPNDGDDGKEDDDQATEAADVANDLADSALRATCGMTRAKRAENMAKLAALGLVPAAGVLQSGG